MQMIQPVKPARQMRLTPDLVARVPPHSGESGRLEGRSDLTTDEDIDNAADFLLADAPESGEVWIFAYGSLIWNPEFAFDAERLGRVAGWHRSFCLGWVRLYRGTPERPGLMLALDRGGSCQGVVFRLPPATMRENLVKILRREMPIKGSHLPARWVKVRTDDGPLCAIAFPISRASASYLTGLTEDEVVEALATAAGTRGTMADYVQSTVSHLEERGIHDRYLWRIQKLIAERIEVLYPAS